MTDLILSQLTDPFRIGLIVVMMLTAYRTRGAMGLMTPMALGVVFVAAIIPMTMQPDSPDQIFAIGTGVLSNVILLLAAMAIRAVIMRILRGGT
jgi:hypothetical protein